MPANMKKAGLFSQLLKITLILGVTAGISWYFLANKTKPQRKPPVILPSVVSVVNAEQAEGKIWIESMGTVKASRELSIVSEVGGRVEWINDKLIPGGIIAKGDIIAKVEKTDYEIALDQANANISTAEKDLLVEQGAARSAKIMEGTSRTNTTEEAKNLRLRVPHIAAAKAQLRAAEKALIQAENDLERTEIKAQYPILVKSENIEIGNYLTKLSVIAEAVGIDQFWVEISVPLNKLQYLKIPGVTSDTGSLARVYLQGAGIDNYVREGRIIRLLGSLDDSGRMAKLLIAIDDPLGVLSNERERPLLLNSFVKVEVEGRDLDTTVKLPRGYLREGDTVWVMDEQNRLKVSDVQIAWRDQDYVYVSDGLAAGERIITTSNFVPVEGMILNTVDSLKTAPEMQRSLVKGGKLDE